MDDKEKVSSEDLAKQKIASEARGLASKGFSTEQIAQQLSVKHAMTIAEVTSIIEQDDPKEDA